MFNQRKPRRFNYKSKLENSKDSNSVDELKTKWDELRDNKTRKQNVLTSLPMLIVFLVAIIALMYVLNGYIN